MTGSYNYKTYYPGTPKDLEESNTLVLIKSSEFKVSLENLNSLQEEINKNPKNTKEAHKNLTTGVFDLYLDGDIFDFDVILYRNSEFVGYTIFSSLQHCYSSSGTPFGKIEISLVFERVQGEGNGFFIELQTYLDSNIENVKIFGSTENWEYQTSNSIPYLTKEDQTLKFTNRVFDYLEDPELCILTDSVVVTHKKGVSGLYVLSGVDIDSESFPFVRPVFYKGDLSVLKFSYQTGEYCVSSLTTLNSFNRPYDYLSGVIEEIPETFLDYNSQVLLFSEEDNYVLYFLETSEMVKYPKKKDGIRNCIVLDRWDPSGKVKYIPESDLKKEISLTCQVPVGFNDNSYSYQGKIGGWWIFKNSTKYTYMSVYGTIEGEVKLDFINSRLGLYQSEDSVYHLLPIDLGHSYKIRSDFKALDKISKVFSDILINPVELLSTLSPDYRCLLDGLRRKPLRTVGCFPKNIIGVGLGMVFYLSDGLLYCY